MLEGDYVAIWTDPLTRLRIEGYARLVRLINNDCGNFEGVRLQRWLVRFERERERELYQTPDSEEVERTIAVRLEGRQFVPAAP